MRWKALTSGFLLTMLVLAGCKQQCYLTECDYQHYTDIGLPPHTDTDPSASVIPCTMNLAAPPTAQSPERPMKPLTLTEAVAMALEQGTIGSPALNGTVNDSLVNFQNRVVSSPENNLRVLSLEPAIAATDIESALSKFDARWTTSMTWQRVNEPVGGNVLQDFNNGDQATFTSSVLKPLPTGGVAGITFTDRYTLLSSPPAGIVNPAYRPNLQFQFEQPLLQGFGVDINQLRAQHPGSQLTPFNTAVRAPEGILVTRLRFDQSRAQFEAQVATLLVNVEVAYWNLYGAYFNLYSQETGLRLALVVWQFNAEQARAGTGGRDRVDQARGQYELFRAERITALAQVLENEHQLRALIGLPVEDGTRLVPVDVPTLSPYQPDWQTALNDALTLRPELELARQDLKFRQLDLINQKNLLLPDLRFASTYNINSLGAQLDGNVTPNFNNGFTGNALRGLADNQFHDWELSLRLDVPLGFRDAHSGVRAARLRLLQSYLVLRDQEQRATRFLADQYQQMIAAYETIQPQRAQRQAFASQYNALQRTLSAGTREGAEGARIDLTALLDALRFYSQAVQAEYVAVVNYNNAMARFEFARGTILKHDNVVISEGALPQCAQVRAVEHERQRSKALIAWERANPVYHPICPYNQGVCYGLPELPTSVAPALPSLMEKPEAPAGAAALPPPQKLPEGTPKTEPEPLPPPEPAGPAPTSLPPELPLTKAATPDGGSQATAATPPTTPAPVVQASFQTGPVTVQQPRSASAAPPDSSRPQGGWIIFTPPHAPPASPVAKPEHPAPTAAPPAPAGTPSATITADAARKQPAPEEARVSAGLVFFRRPAAVPVATPPVHQERPASPAQPAGTHAVQQQVPGANRQAALLSTLHQAMLPSDREAAAEALAARRYSSQPQVIDTLRQAACEDPAASVRLTCIRCLVEAGANTDGVRRGLLQLQTDSDPEVRQEAGTALRALDAQAAR